MVTTAVPAPAIRCGAKSGRSGVPGALGIQEAALVMVCGFVGLSPETAMLIAIVKRLRDVALGIPGLVMWQWVEGRPRRQPQLAAGGS
jgi:hypothetical protein